MCLCVNSYEGTSLDFFLWGRKILACYLCVGSSIMWYAQRSVMENVRSSALEAVCFRMMRTYWKSALIQTTPQEQ